ncbi:MAG: tRNA (adenosine(37)-N6)-threonylcarbamoyltransferase complex ATPase subunit type 1 TsaE [Bacteroidales bacterium]|nr:tRNA (adenosine(37)-N6)-threonylcarbamoyltransferase complex ATPase subunit type 1 TsaE [Bacteroidales bacterium]
MLRLTFNQIDQLPEVAKRLLAEFPDERFYAFFGSMGVGKTTLIKEICAQLGVEQNVCSPTFAIINEYADRDGEPVYHFDFYRLKNLDEAYDIGYEEYFYSGCWCFTEWTEKIEPLLPDHYLRIEIVEEKGIRTLTSIAE